MLPWMRVPNAKSTVAHVVEPRPRIDEEPGLVVPEQRMDRWIGMAFVSFDASSSSPHSIRFSAIRSWAMYSRFG